MNRCRYCGKEIKGNVAICNDCYEKELKDLEND